MALAEYNDLYWFPTGEPARNTPARVFPEHSNTFAQLYADQAGTQPLPNPLNTDNDGRLRFWVEAGIYWISIDQESIRVPIGTGEQGVTPQQVDAAIAAHNADTTEVHGIPDTSQLLTSADLPDLSGYATDAELAAHAADTTGVHGIADTSVLETQAGAQAKADAARDQATADATGQLNEARGELQEQITAGDQAQAAALAAHAADTTNVHGIPDTSTIPTNEQFQQVQAALAAHEADTTGVHGIADTAALATDADVAAVQAQVTDHVADTTGVHGIADTSQLLTSADLEQYATDADLAAHTAATTGVHGIADTADLVTSADLAGLATDAEVSAATGAVQAALDAHAADTTGVHGIADTAALATQADLTGLVSQAEFDAHADATTNVHGITDTAALLTQADLDQYATDAELAAHVNDTTGVHGIADTSVLETQAGAQAKADAAQTTAIDMAAGLVTEHANDTTGVHGIEDTGALETQSGAQAKADAAQAAATTTAQNALDAHAADTTSVHGIANTAALETQAGAQAKADAAEDSATAAAQAALDLHAADTTNVHGIADTASLETIAGAQAKANAAQSGAVATAQAALDAHAADTTGVHGITDTAVLETQAGAQAKADAGRDAAIADAAAKYLNRTTGGTVTGPVGIRTAGDAQDRIVFGADGSIGWGPGNAGSDVHMRRTGVNMLQLDDNWTVVGSSTLAGLLQLQRTTATSVGVASLVTGEANDSFRLLARGQMEWGPGTAARDAFLSRESAGVMAWQDTIQRVYRATAGGNAVATRVIGDTASRWFVNADGAQWWGPGGATGVDVGLWRSAAGQLTTGGTFQTIRSATTDAVRDVRITGDSQPRFYQTASGQMYWGNGGASALDTVLYRDQAGSLVTDGNFTVNGLGYFNNIQINGQLTVGGVGQRLFARRTSDLTRTNTATRSNDTQLTLTLAANAVYEVHALVIWGGSANGDIALAFSAPTGATGWWSTVQPSTTAAADPTSVRIPANQITQFRTYGWFDMGSPNAAIISAIVVTGASGGTYALSWAQAVADATGTTVYTNSFLSAERVA